MAGQNRTTAHAVAFESELERQPYRFGYFHALRLLECLNPAKPRIGESSRPADDPLRLCQQPSLAFAPSMLSSYRRLTAASPPRLSVLFFGLFGPDGPLPLHLTEYARERTDHYDDETFMRFADVFHHRMLSLFYRAWATAQPAVQHDRPESDRFAVYLGSLFGLGMPSLWDRDSVPDLAKLHYAGRFACQTRHPEGLRAILEDYLRLPVQIHEFIGTWLKLPDDCLCRLGQSPNVATLGESIIVGSQVWDGQQTFRIEIGPVGFDDYQRLLPGRDSFRRVVDMVRNYVGDELQWQLKLVLKKEEVPLLSLGQQSHLGWTTWTLHKPLPEDAGDLVLQPQPDAAV